jgi:recombinational DNA repair protein RecR
MREDAMPDTATETQVEERLEPCPACGSLNFNRECEECVELREEVLLMGLLA